MQLIDQVGRVIQEQTLFIKRGFNQFTLQPNLAPGIYSLQVVGENLRISEKIIRIR